MKDRVLITGASGFVGYHLVREALANGYEVYAAVRRSSIIDHLDGLPLQFVHLDYGSVDSLQRDLDVVNVDYIIHAAGLTRAKSQANYNQVNADTTKRLAEASVLGQVPLKKFVFVSSLAALGPSTNLDTLIRDTSEAQPVTAYGRSKLLAERYLMEMPELPLLGFRPTAVYGPRERDLFVLIKSISRGLDPYIGKFNQQLSFVYVKDLAKIILESLSKDTSKRFYNISDGQVYGRYALADTAKRVLEKKALRIHLPRGGVALLADWMDRFYARRQGTPILNKEKLNELTAVNWGCDISDIQKDLDYIPQYDLNSGLFDTIRWYQEQGWL